MLNKKIAKKITKIFIEALKQDRIPWRRPWTYKKFQNFETKREYKGINAFLLSCFNFKTPYFLTFNQIKKLGGHLKKGSKSVPIVFWTVKEKEIKKINQETEEEEIKKITYPILRYYNVFNLEYVDGIKYELEKNKNIDSIKEAENIINNFKNKPEIINTYSQRAYYLPLKDKIVLPFKTQFKNIHSYYSTLFHELIHSTGHEKRLNRDSLINFNSFGTKNYSKEELVAEIGASFLRAHCNINIEQTIENSKAYIQSWIEVLNNNPYWILQASNKAQKAVDYIFNN